MSSAKSWLMPFFNWVPGSPERSATSCHSAAHSSRWAWTPLCLPFLPIPEAQAASEHGDHQVWLHRDQDPQMVKLLAPGVPALPGVPERHGWGQHTLGADSVSSGSKSRVMKGQEGVLEGMKGTGFLGSSPDLVLFPQKLPFLVWPLFLLCKVGSYS